MSGRIIDALEWFAVLLVAVFVVVILLWEPLQSFWTKRTWREEQGLFVRDYTALRASIKIALRRGFYLLLIVAALLWIWRIL